MGILGEIGVPQAAAPHFGGMGIILWGFSLRCLSTPLRKKVCTPAEQINFELRSTHSQPKVRTEATGDLGGVAAVSASRLPQQVSKKNSLLLSIN